MTLEIVLPSIDLECEPDLLRKIMSYDPQTGIFTWRAKIASKVVVGRRVGSQQRIGYWSTQISGRQYYLHRLAFASMGEPVPTLVDHIDRDRGNNRWANLRPATKSLNGANVGRRKSNKTGIPNVYWDKTRLKWAVCIKVMGRTVNRGRYDSLVDAEHAAKEARRDVHGL